MNAEVLKLCEAVRDAGGRAMLVGGSVRDQFLEIESMDFDVEVYGLEAGRLRLVLEQLGQVNTVGEHFSVYKLVPASTERMQSGESAAEQPRMAKSVPHERFEIDVSLPRRESKSGRGHRGFVIEGDPAMSFAEAARRRDFTINAILYDPLTDEIDDPFNGREDLRHRILRAVAADTFIEDSLRVLRAIQLAARFEMTIEPQTVALCRTMELSDLPHERIRGEIEKLLILARRPSIGLDKALELGVFQKLFPAIQSLIDRDDQEGANLDRSSFTRTKLAVDEAAKLVWDLPKAKQLAVMLATLCHDLSGEPAGVAPHTAIPSLAEAEKGRRDATRAILTTLGVFGIGGYDVRSQVLSLVTEYLKPGEFYRRREATSDGDFRRLAGRVDLELLYRMAKACSFACGQPSSGVAVEWFIERARMLGVEHGPPPPLLQGRHLVEAGFEPGPRMGQMLRGVYELQLDDEVTTLEEAIAAAIRLNSGPPELFR
jgi:tRNA nucleotidyltransferase (CCA-adding enzyme)